MVCRLGGSDTFSYSPALASRIKEVNYVVSSNQDSANAGNVGDAFVDVDPVVPGTQVPLRAAMIDANGWTTPTFIYVPRGKYQLTLFGADPGAAVGDLDVAANRTMRIIGAGAGETIIDASWLRDQTAFSDRVFDVAPGATLTLDNLTVTGGRAPAATNEYHGGGIHVRGGAGLYLNGVAVVDNQAWSDVSNGGGIYFADGAGGIILNSVITGNSTSNITQNSTTANCGGGIYLASPAGPVATVALAGTIVAKNSAATGSVQDAYAPVNRSFVDYWFNRLTTAANGITHNVNGNHVGAVDYVVTGVADTYYHTNDATVLSLRDAIDLANTTAGAQEIWLPGWKFTLTLQRVAAANQTETFVWQGDLEIDQSLTIRGVDNATSVGWQFGLPNDKVFELLGDYNNSGTVDAADYVAWRNRNPLADGDDNGTIDNADYNIYRSHFGNFLELLGVSVV